jgi:hypothetical protein
MLNSCLFEQKTMFDVGSVNLNSSRTNNGEFSVDSKKSGIAEIMTRLGVTKSRWWRRQTLNKTNWLNRNREAVPNCTIFCGSGTTKRRKVSCLYQLQNYSIK